MKNRELFKFIRHAINRADGSDEMIDAALDFLQQLQYDYNTKLLESEEPASEQEEESSPEEPEPESEVENYSKKYSEIVLSSYGKPDILIFDDVNSSYVKLTNVEFLVSYYEDCGGVVCKIYNDLFDRDWLFSVFLRGDSFYDRFGCFCITSDSCFNDFLELVSFFINCGCVYSYSSDLSEYVKSLCS